MNDRFRISSLWAQRLTERKLTLPTLLRLAGLPAGFFQQDKIYATTAELFALWRASGELSPDPGIGLKLGTEPRFERYQPTAIAAVELNETAFLLGYEDANSFFRAFHVWEGTSPGEWRTRHRNAEVEAVGN